MQVIEIPTGFVSVSTGPGHDYIIRLDDSTRSRGAVGLTSDEAADVLEAMVVSGVRLTERARQALVRSGSVGLTYDQAYEELKVQGLVGLTRGDVLDHQAKAGR